MKSPPRINEVWPLYGTAVTAAAQFPQILQRRHFANPQQSPPRNKIAVEKPKAS